MKRIALLLLFACGSPPAPSVVTISPVERPAEPAPKPTAITFTVALDLDALRSRAATASILQALSATDDVREVRTRTGFDPFADASWMVLGGPEPGLMKPGFHGVADGAKAETIARAGGTPLAAGGAHVSLYGVQNDLLMPRTGIVTFAPPAVHPALASPLASPELATVHLHSLEPQLPPEITEIHVRAVPWRTSDFFFEAEGACSDRCEEIAQTYRDRFAQIQKAPMLRMVTRGAFAPLAKVGSPTEDGIWADEHTLRARLHLTGEDVQSLSQLAMASLGVH